MLQSLAAVTILVPSYDEGLAFFRDVLGFAVLEDTPLVAEQALGRRRPVAEPQAPRSCSRFRATNVRGAALATRPEGGSAFFFTPATSGRTTRMLRRRGVNFLETPRREPYGLVAVFADPWGGKWDLLQPASRSS